ncbi:MAG: SRPBCC family protein [Bacteriovoracaceae bacterium]|nr:SRPBCC family protein [Bacteriovoracaceae bacterium]
MAKVERKEIFNVDINKIYNVIVDYASYPDFVDGVSEIEVLEQNETSARVKYSLNLIKKFSYTIKLTQKKPTSVSWVLESGDIFKSNSGSWELKDLGQGKTEVKYSLDIDFKILAPKMIVNKLVATNLPTMMKAYQERAKKV